MRGRLVNLRLDKNGRQNITISIDSDFSEMYDKLQDEEISIEIKKASKRRSMEANAYLWHLCSEIAKASSKYSNDGKDDVYREAIKAKGEFEELFVKEKAVDYFVKKWGQKGTGWFAEVVDEYIGPASEYEDLMGDNVERYKQVHAYYGSSTYDSAAMSRVIDYVVNVAADLGIPTITEKDRDMMMQLWGDKNG